MPVVSADVEFGPPFFLFKALKMTFRQVVNNGRVIAQLNHYLLPSRAVVSMRE